MSGTLRLTAADRKTITRLQSIFLTARLDNDNVVKGLLIDIAELIGSRRGFAAHSLGEDFRFVSVGIGPQIEEYTREAFLGFDPIGNYRFSDPELEEINRRRREMGPGVYHEGRLQQRDLIKQTRYYKTAFLPAGMHHVVGMSTPFPQGEAVLAFGFEDDDDPGFVDSRSAELLELLHPAFCAGFNSAFTRANAQRDVDAALAANPGSRLHGRERPDDIHAGSIYPGPALPGLAKSWITARKGDWLATPQPTNVAETLGLTKRQTEVFWLIMEGLTASEIAQNLNISVHTARRHSDAILKRAKVRSLTALVVKLTTMTGSC